MVIEDYDKRFGEWVMTIKVKVTTRRGSVTKPEECKWNNRGNGMMHDWWAARQWEETSRENPWLSIHKLARRISRIDRFQHRPTNSSASSSLPTLISHDSSLPYSNFNYLSLMQRIQDVVLLGFRVAFWGNSWFEIDHVLSCAASPKWFHHIVSASISFCTSTSNNLRHTSVDVVLWRSVFVSKLYHSCH